MRVRILRASSWILDIDGCLVLGDGPGGEGGRVLPGAGELLCWLADRGVGVLCCTNASARPPDAYAAGLRERGLVVEDASVVTPAVVAAAYLARRRPSAEVMVIGGEGVRAPLVRVGLGVVPAEAGHAADVVLVGSTRTLEATQLQAAAESIWNGAEFLVTSEAPVAAGRQGRLASMSAAVAAGLARVTGVAPTVVGKPSPLVVEHACARFGTAPDDVVVVGDDPALDIALGRAAGSPTVLVLSGITDGDEARALPAAQAPDLVADDVGALLELLSQPPLERGRGA